ncbi:MAG: DNA replication/repair protein RecF [Thiotrichales bacterium]|nr:DNA replication/repair protein RecF [Thiotrichales bacterium]
MAHIKRLHFQHFRNAEQLRCELGTGLNLFIGDNAAGKTSVLEALWFLATGRSFRNAQIGQLIQHSHPQTTLFIELHSQRQPLNPLRIGVQRQAQHNLMRLNGENVRAHSEIAQHLPLQLLTPESHRLLEEGPNARRQFMDWGCFYQFADFIQLWRQQKRLLKQRNQALKQRLPAQQIQLWDAPLVESAIQIDQMRRHYLEGLTPLLQDYCQTLMPELSESVVCHYRAGWPKGNDDLLGLFKDNLGRDLALGHTQYGAHRADIRFRFGGQEAMQKLSRGQQKLFVCALLLAQAKLHQNLTEEPAIMLIDDLPAELDATHRHTLLKLLAELNIQHIVTSTALNLIPLIHPSSIKAWKIEQGVLQALNLEKSTSPEI